MDVNWYLKCHDMDLYFLKGWNHANKCYYLLKSHPMSFFGVSGFKGFTPLAICEENQIFTLCCFFAVLFLVPFSVVCCCLRQAENFEEFFHQAMTGRLFSLIHWHMLRFAASKPPTKTQDFSCHCIPLSLSLAGCFRKEGYPQIIH